MPTLSVATSIVCFLFFAVPDKTVTLPALVVPPSDRAPDRHVQGCGFDH